MTRFRRTSARFPGRRSRRPVEWISAATTAFTPLTAPGVAAGYLILPSTLRERFTDPTIVRCRGQISIQNAISQSPRSVLGAVGIITWKDRDDATPADPPRPFTDSDLDWMWHSYFFGGQSGTNPNRLGFYWNEGFSGTSVDTKAMRKIGADQGLLYVVENVSVTTNDLEYALGIRALVKDG